MDLLSRRVFTLKAGKLLLATSVAAFLPMSACNWVAFLVDYIPYINRGLDVIVQYFGILLPPGVGLILTAIKGGLLDLQGAAIEYQNAPAADKGSILGRIETFLKGIVDNFQQVLDTVGTSSPIPAIILGVVNIILSTLTWLVGKFSKAATTRMLMPMNYKLRAGGNQILFISPVERSKQKFIDDINSLLAANGRTDLRIN